MDCLRSFNFRIDTNTNITTGVKTWTTGGGGHYWAVNAGTSSTYNIQGYKNINVYGIEVVGAVQTLPTAGTGGVVVNDWTIDIFLDGVQPILGSNITSSPNFYSISNTSLGNKVFPIGKYNSNLQFGDPYESVKSIQILDTNASGFGWETLTNVNLFWNLNFIVYYKFEGE